MIKKKYISPKMLTITQRLQLLAGSGPNATEQSDPQKQHDLEMDLEAFGEY